MNYSILIFKPPTGDKANRVFEYYEDIHAFVTRLCLEEKLPQSCISTAMIFFHKFFIFKKFFENDFEKYLTCAACIFISVKVCNQLTPLKELVNFFLRLYIRQKNITMSIDEKTIFETCEKLCQIEFDVLNTIGFDLNVDLPYKYVHMMKFYYVEYLKNPKLITITTNFINDSFKLPLCINYDPLLIALASLYLTSVYFKVPLPKTREGKKWFQLLENNIMVEDVISVSEKINKIYKFCNEEKEKKINKKIELRQGVPVIKFEPSVCILFTENLQNIQNLQSMQNIQSNLDVNVSISGKCEPHDHIKYNDDRRIPDNSVNLLEKNGV
jgi:hypothetical protein